MVPRHADAAQHTTPKCCSSFVSLHSSSSICLHRKPVFSAYIVVLLLMKRGLVHKSVSNTSPVELQSLGCKSFAAMRDRQLTN